MMLRGVAIIWIGSLASMVGCSVCEGSEACNFDDDQLDQMAFDEANNFVQMNKNKLKAISTEEGETCNGQLPCPREAEMEGAIESAMEDIEDLEDELKEAGASSEIQDALSKTHQKLQDALPTPAPTPAPTSTPTPAPPTARRAPAVSARPARPAAPTAAPPSPTSATITPEPATSTASPKEGTTTLLAAERSAGGSTVTTTIAMPSTKRLPSTMPSTATATTTMVCAIWADPHVSGFDNTDNQGPGEFALLQMLHSVKSSSLAMSFDRHPTDVNAYGAGDVWLVRSKDVHIQGRFRYSGEFQPDRAAVGAIAVGGPFMEGHHLIIEPLDGQVTVDGQSHDSGVWSEDFIHIRQVDNVVKAILPLDVRLEVRRFEKHVDVKISMSKLDGSIDGQCGNYNGVAEDDDTGSLEGRNVLTVDKSQLLFQDLEMK